MSSHPRSNPPRMPLAFCVLAGLLALAAAQAHAATARLLGAQPQAIEVTFDPLCTSAQVSAGKPLSAIEIVFDGGEVERVSQLKRLPSYRVKLAASAVAAGRFISSVSVVEASPDITAALDSMSETPVMFSCFLAQGTGNVLVGPFTAIHSDQAGQSLAHRFPESWWH